MLLAKVTFLGPEQGGRSIPPQAGYHPQIDAGGVYTSCRIEPMGDEQTFEFNTEYDVSLQLLFPELYERNFSLGSVVHFYEGNRLIGQGTIIDR